MGFVGNDNNITAGRKRLIGSTFRRQEFLDGGKNDAARGYIEQLAQVSAILSLNRALAQQLVAAGEHTEELNVKVNAVGQHNDGRVLHGRVQDEPSGVENHGE